MDVYVMNGRYISVNFRISNPAKCTAKWLLCAIAGNTVKIFASPTIVNDKLHNHRP